MKKYLVFNKSVGQCPTVRIKPFNGNMEEIKRLLMLGAYDIAICNSYTEAKCIEYQNKRILGLPTEDLVAYVK